MTGTAQEAAPTPDKYLAFQVPNLMTSEERRSLFQSAADAGLKTLKDAALEREGLLVIERPEDPALVEKNVHIFSSMRPVPIREFRGVLSVPAGNFYLRFKGNVTSAVARKRLTDLGFKVITPGSDQSSVLVVEGTGRPADRDRELATLKTLPELLYVAPNDIPLRIPASSPK